MAVVEDKKKYRPLEPILIQINKDFISLSKDEMKRNNALLMSLMDLLIPEMKRKDPLFKEMYTKVFYGGSYYDKLRVKEPNEFDLDLLLTLPVLSEPLVSIANVPGYTTLKLNNLSALNKHADLAKRYSGLSKLLENEKDCYLDNDKVRRWMESVVTLALNTFPHTKGNYELKLPQGKFIAKVHKSGPAFTLKLNGTIDRVDIAVDIDLVPCFMFNIDKLPVKKLNSGFKSKTFFIVPKPIKNNSAINCANRYWRLSYQEQEREIMECKNNQYLKPTIKLLKKLKEMDHPYIASYFIKTVVIWEAEKRKDDESFWNTSFSYVFMTCLKKYCECIENKKIPYYWNKNNNLIQNISPVVLGNLKCRLNNIIKNIEKNMTDNPKIFAEYFLTEEEKLRLYSSLNLNIQ
ncbi:unnamed protein product [Phyllotreta striolata]|uniref:Cyclic GMP-AMP synthase n=1 Tax=Phyllotreta striolata TaxID=444603 RepID=A0A9N9TTV0_PHYSR|nr:unnamed protein product [Phyllotreta striolata]